MQPALAVTITLSLPPAEVKDLLVGLMTLVLQFGAGVGVGVGVGVLVPNVAVTFVGKFVVDDIITVQVVVIPVQPPPLQPVNALAVVLSAGVAVRVTDAPLAKGA
ncbi:MAG: hypothetical protein HQL03_05685 [Nitrospirae bacterium]|nr:hypothetical protein [Nitrospirota bacterium]